MIDSSYSIINIDLSIARTRNEHRCGLSDTLLVQDITNLNSNLKISFDNSDSDITIIPSDTYNFSDKEVFSKVYISNDAVVGTATLIFSRKIEIRKLIRITSDIIQFGINQGVINVTDTATPVPAIALTNRINILIYNNTLETIYIGNSAVDTTDGFPVKPNSSFGFTLAKNVVLYAVCLAGHTASLNYIEGA